MELEKTKEEETVDGEGPEEDKVRRGGGGGVLFNLIEIFY